jgi:hypothetical protein
MQTCMFSFFRPNIHTYVPLERYGIATLEIYLVGAARKRPFSPVCMYVFMCEFMYVCMYVWTFGYCLFKLRERSIPLLYVRMYVCMRLCMCLRTAPELPHNTHTHTHTYTYKFDDHLHAQTYEHTHIRTHTPHIQTHIHTTHTHTYVCICILISFSSDIHACIHTHAQNFAYIRVNVCNCRFEPPKIMHTHIHTEVCIYTNMHTCRLKPPMISFKGFQLETCIHTYIQRHAYVQMCIPADSSHP